MTDPFWQLMILYIVAPSLACGYLLGRLHAFLIYMGRAMRRR